MPVRYQVDTRLLGHAALVRSGQITRDEGIALLARPQEYDPELVTMVVKRLGFTDQEFAQVMSLPRRTYREFKTYKRTFERLGWLFWILYKLNRVPKSFYLKFTKPDPLPPIAPKPVVDQSPERTRRPEQPRAK
jgi:hypothetical protein